MREIIHLCNKKTQVHGIMNIGKYFKAMMLFVIRLVLFVFP